jgi:hypothetical protein
LADQEREPALVNQGRDVLTLGFAGTDLLGNSPFAPAEILRLDRVVDAVATTVFRGRLISETRGAYGATEGLTVQLAGPWWYLENLIVYMQLARVCCESARREPGSGPSGCNANRSGLRDRSEDKLADRLKRRSKPGDDRQ